MQKVLVSAQLARFSTDVELEVDVLEGSSLLAREPRMPPTVAAIAIMMTMKRMIIKRFVFHQGTGLTYSAGCLHPEITL